MGAYVLSLIHMCIRDRFTYGPGRRRHLGRPEDPLSGVAVEQRMLHKLRDDVQRETAMIEERGDDAEPALGWVLEEVMKLRAEDDQAVKDGKRESDREHELHMIESDLVGLGKPDWLQVGVALGSAQRREMLAKLRQRDQEARNAMAAGREEFVTAAGDWLAGPPPLDGPRGTVRVLPGTRWHCRLRLLRSRS
ncbi:hypothetical protein [Streptomyces resistomycificus]|nr:hypothetical protein [Streptomyces resistomycificus]